MDGDVVDGDVADSGDGCVSTIYHPDTDGDGFGDADASLVVEACEAPAGMIEDGSDCDDTDGDVHPGATEVCDGADNDCNGTADDGVTTTYYPDADTDGFGDASGGIDACEAPVGMIEDATDCDDSDATTQPGATEVCDGADNDCNGTVDDGLSAPSCALTDGVCADSVQLCGGEAGWLACDASSYGASYEMATETLCDGLDNDCDGSIDEGVKTRFYRDGDGDTHGDASDTGLLRCTAPAGRVTSHDDCDDANAMVHPGQAEICDGLDNDCNGAVDDGLTFRNYYEDADSDGYGNPAVRRNACAMPTGFVTDNTDCHDTDANAHPGQTAYFTSRIMGTVLADPLNFDYDCNGSVVKQYPVVTSCPDNAMRPGWERGTPLPWCGDTGNYNTIISSPYLILCESPAARTQSCH